MICDNLSIVNGQLHFAGQNTVTLAKQYGTPLYLLDEDYIRRQCRVYKAAFQKHFGPGAKPLYASKANAFRRMYQIMTEEDMGIDVVSPGEIYTAYSAGYDLSNAYFHGSNKTDGDIAYAMDCGVGCFVADNREELLAIEAECARRGTRQQVLLRLSPGIDPHTYEAVATGKVDSKFGVAIETGQAEELVLFALELPHVDLAGFHCHVGSQVFGEDIFQRAAVIMLEFIAHLEHTHGFKTAQLDLGGGYGVAYTEADPHLDVEEKVAEVAAAVKKTCTRLGIAMPEIHMEPGRSIVAAAGMTLYTVGAVKRITGYKNYVSVDGGMVDNPRYALYKSAYTCYLANKMDEVQDFAADVVGRCCESGDILQPDVMMSASVERGDTLAVCTTGAYNYSMASNYNRLPRPPIVMLHHGESYVAVRRESFEDLCRNDM
ncbi:MAG: diaminopimelate decarboxylase [Oscillospiraceae bacterium]|nr:diaminopimelate decarboxylase [Oscillospiraceae bacterium]